jgi:hypothetical protein
MTGQRTSSAVEYLAVVLVFALTCGAILTLCLNGRVDASTIEVAPPR